MSIGSILAMAGSKNFARYKPVLTQLDESVVQSVSEALVGMRFWDLSPELMRNPGYPDAPLGDRGENLPTVLEKACADPQLRSTLVSWLQELTPMSDLEFQSDPRRYVHLMLCERNGRKISADSASDGTLRFLAVLAALLGKDPPGLCFFEEIDTGIHPARLNLLMELIERQTEKRGIQVLTTTHASTMLTVMNDSTLPSQTRRWCLVWKTAPTLSSAVLRTSTMHRSCVTNKTLGDFMNPAGWRTHCSLRKGLTKRTLHESPLPLRS